jgi:lipoate-protein ligase A
MDSALRLVDSGLVDPPTSAAIDEAILDSHSRGSSPDTLHYYLRSSPTVSVGYFQKVRESVDLDACRRLGVSVVRRGSGGSSIYTDRGQLIYAIVLGEDALPPTPDESFGLVCGSIARALSTFGVEARHRPVNDVEVAGRKVSGSAQLRRRGSVLVHGTVIVDTALSVMDAVLRPKDGLVPSERVANLAALVGAPVPMDEVKSRLTYSLSEALDGTAAPGALTSSEEDMVDALVRERYSRDEWNMMR